MTTQPVVIIILIRLIHYFIIDVISTRMINKIYALEFNIIYCSLWLMSDWTTGWVEFQTTPVGSGHAKVDRFQRWYTSDRSRIL